MEVIGDSIATVIKNLNDSAIKSKAKSDIRSLCNHFPIYEGLIR
jgi:glycine/serine hydroxymethyltransferase